jgi:hypothetical protein
MDSILKNSSITHPALAALYSLIVFLVAHLVFQVPPNYSWTFAALLVAVFFFAREAGQLEHDFKNQGSTSLQAWYRATLPFFWPGSNILQFILPAVSATVVGFLLYTASK